jgi:hypothetical protein
MAYVVFVGDNFHYMDETERSKLGEFDTCEAAQAACRKIVDEFLLANHKPGQSAAELYGTYRDFGDDPFIVGTPPCPFSAWSYAKRRAEEICRPLAGNPR